MNKNKCGICKRELPIWESNICVDCRRKKFVDTEKNGVQVGLKA